MCCDKNRQERRSPTDIPRDQVGDIPRGECFLSNLYLFLLSSSSCRQVASFHEKFEPELCHYILEICSPLLCPAVMVSLSSFLLLSPLSSFLSSSLSHPSTLSELFHSILRIPLPHLPVPVSLSS
jgi:hypothetical protein